MNKINQNFYSDTEIEQQKKLSDLKEAGVLFSDLNDYFSYVTEWNIPTDIEKNIMINKLRSDFAEKEARWEEKKEAEKGLTIDIPNGLVFPDIEEHRTILKYNEKLIRESKIEISREFYAPENLFEIKCQDKRKDDPTFDIVVFAQCEMERIEGVLDEIRQLSDKSYYCKEETYEQALKYVKQLNKVINNKPENKEKPAKEPIDTLEKAKYPEKFYAWHDAIAMFLGIINPHPNSFSKKEIENFGVRVHNFKGKGEGYRKELKRFNIHKINPFIRSMPPKDRTRWKKIIIDISNNNADVIYYVNELPN